MNSASLLLEIGTEELPPKLLESLSQQFGMIVKDALTDWKLDHGQVQTFASPRRLAVLISEVPMRQTPSKQVRKGPSIRAAIDSEGKPTAAGLGFAKSCKTDFKKLDQMDINGQTFLCFEQTLEGEILSDLIQAHFSSWLERIQAPKKMRWGGHNDAFVRPIHWICAMHGHQALAIEWNDIVSSHVTYGHRFHSPHAIHLTHAEKYESSLLAAKVVANLASRKALISKQVKELAAQVNAEPIISTELLDEVTNLVEWPYALLGEFEPNLLKVPSSALVTAMQHHQKCFALMGTQPVLMPKFILISNIEPDDTQFIIKGNERVINARLNDAKFFFEVDQKTMLIDQNNKLRSVVFQKQLGSMHDKVIRISKLAKALLPLTLADENEVQTAAELCKADLMTEMVNEFPELQGIMGHAYALLEGYSNDIATGIEESYLPRCAGDKLPDTPIGLTLSLADRLDTLVGIFSIGGAPTGDKDPFGLRRIGIGVLRILIEKSLSIDIYELLNNARENYTRVIESDVLPEILNFLQDRLKSLMHDRGYDLKVIDAVLSTYPTNPYDAYLRIQAVKRFCELPEAESLAAANKRVRNILTKTETGLLYSPEHINDELLQNPAEQSLVEALNHINEKINPLLVEHNYTDALTELANLKSPIDVFFEEVMVMSDVEAIRQNRILILNHLHHAFKRIADLSRL